MEKIFRHFDPLRPNRALEGKEKYEFTHGTNSVCVCDIETMDFIKEIPVGPRPDCHSTSLNNRYLYIACEDGLYCIDQEQLKVLLNITGYIQGISVGVKDEIFVYGCSGNGALVRFGDIAGEGCWTISYPGG